MPKPPKPDWSKVNCDGAFCSKTSQAGIGVIIRDHNGTLLHGAGVKVSGDSVFGLEAMAVKAGLKMAKQLDLKQIEVEMDNEVLFRSLTSNSKGSDWCISPVIADIEHLLRSFYAVEFKWVCREANSAADWVRFPLMPMEYYLL